MSSGVKGGKPQPPTSPPPKTPTKSGQRIITMSEDKFNEMVAKAVAGEVAKALALINATAPPPKATRPRIGGIINGSPWTGGKPNLAQNGHDEPLAAAPASTACTRLDGGMEPERFTTTGVLTQKPESLDAYEIDQSKELFEAFCTNIQLRAKEVGLDAILYLRDPTNTKMVHVIEAYRILSRSFVKVEMEKQRKLWDSYDVQNNKSMVLLLLNCVGPLMKRRIGVFDPKLELTAVEIFMIVAQRDAYVSATAIQDIREKLKDLKLSSYPGYNVHKYTEAVVALKNELDNTNSYDQEETLHVLEQLSQACLPLRFREKAGKFEELVEDEIRHTSTMSRPDAEYYMATQGLDLRTIVGSMDSTYTNLKKKWTLAENKVDQAGLNANELNSAIRQEIQKEVAAQTNSNSGNGNGGNKNNSNGNNCSKCGSNQHYADNCKYKTVTRFPDSKPEAPKHIYIYGKTYSLCLKCTRTKRNGEEMPGRYVRNHETDSHDEHQKKEDEKKKKDNETETTSEVETNSFETTGVVQWDPIIV